MDSIYQAPSCRATSTCQMALLWGVMLRSRHNRSSSHWNIFKTAPGGVLVWKYIILIFLNCCVSMQGGWKCIKISCFLRVLAQKEDESPSNGLTHWLFSWNFGSSLVLGAWPERSIRGESKPFKCELSVAKLWPCCTLLRSTRAVAVFPLSPSTFSLIKLSVEATLTLISWGTLRIVASDSASRCWQPSSFWCFTGFSANCGVRICSDTSSVGKISD